MYCARQHFTGRQVALKMLSHEYSDDDRAKRRLVREARALELARSRHVVDVLDAGQTNEGAPYLAMDMLDGRSLQGILTARQRLRVSDTVAIGVQLCRALAHSHAHGVVHRDIKPSNVMFARTPEGDVVAKLIDFGIAALVEPTQGPLAPSSPDTKITRAGEFFGTPEYLAPECMHQFDRIDRRSDVYSLGITLFECLAGSVPYSGNFGEVLVKVFMGPHPSVRTTRPDVPAYLADTIARAMNVKAEERFEDAAAMEQALMQALQPGQQHTIDESLPHAEAPQPEHLLATDPAIAQRRKFARAPYVTPVQVALPNGALVVGKSEDISLGGLLVLTEMPCGNGDRARVRFSSPLSGRLVEVTALTRWVKSARGRAAIGLEFTDIQSDLAGEISEYVALASQDT